MLNDEVKVCDNSRIIEHMLDSYSEDAHKLKSIGQKLQCQLHYSQLSSGVLVLWSEPFENDLRTSNKGHQFLTDWTNAFLQAQGTLPPSVYFEQTVQKLTDTKASDLDQLLTEEAARSEGKFRLVFDEMTSEVVTLERLINRVLQRAASRVLSVGESGVSATHNAQIQVDQAKKKPAIEGLNANGGKRSPETTDILEAIEPPRETPLLENLHNGIEKSQGAWSELDKILKLAEQQGKKRSLETEEETAEKRMRLSKSYKVENM